MVFGLIVVVFCKIILIGVVLLQSSLEFGKVTMMIEVKGLMIQYLEICNVQIYVKFNDGVKMDLMGDFNVVIMSNEVFVIVMFDGVLIVQLDGIVMVIVELKDGVMVVVSGTIEVMVEFFILIGLMVLLVVFQVVLSVFDLVVTIKGVFLSMQLVVSVQYVDGISIDFISSSIYNY